MNREAVYAALWARLEALDGFVTKSRRLLHWNDVPRHDQPALFMAQGNQQALTKTGEAGKWLLRADVYIYVQTDDQPPAPIINPLIDAVCAAANAIHPVTGRTALVADGAVIEYCRVEGTIETDEGTLGSQAVAIVPIVILAA